MKIIVTQEDIDGCKPRSTCLCPMALAIARALGEPRGLVIVDFNQVCYRQQIIALPQVASDFVTSFDLGEGVQPFEFEMPLESEVAA